MIGFILMAILVRGEHVNEMDSAIIAWIQNMEHPILTQIAVGLSFIGSRDPVILLTIIVIVLSYRLLKHRMEIVLLIGVVLGSSILNLLLKLGFQRARPDLHRLVEITGYSFPSGHSMAAFSFYGVLAYLLWRHIPSNTGRWMLVIIATVMILSIGISRIYLGVHYPSDILGGYLAACTWLALLVGSYERRMGKRAVHERS